MKDIINKIDELAKEIIDREIDNSFGTKFICLKTYWHLDDNYLCEYFTDEGYYKICNVQKASDIDYELLLKLKTYMDNFNYLLEEYNPSFDMYLISDVVNEINEVLASNKVLKKIKGNFIN